MAMRKSEDVWIDRIAGGLQGLLIGDALGVPYEFHAAEDLPPAALIDFDPPSTFRRSHHGVPPGTWSDDGAQALCLLASLLDCDGLNLTSFAGRLLNWAAWGYLAVDGHVFDIGVQTQRALECLKQGVPPELAGPASEYDNGNGALMTYPSSVWLRSNACPHTDIPAPPLRAPCFVSGHARSLPPPLHVGKPPPTGSGPLGRKRVYHRAKSILFLIRRIFSERRGQAMWWIHSGQHVDHWTMRAITRELFGKP